MLEALLACVVQFTGLPHPAGPLPIVHVAPAMMEAEGIWGRYNPLVFPVVYLKSPPEGHWSLVILAHELTHHVQHEAGAQYSEQQAWEAGYACVRKS